MGVTLSEASLFHIVQYGITLSPPDLPALAAGECYRLGDSVTEEDCRTALTTCLAKGWLQIIDESALARIVEELREGQFLGPIYRLPPVGGVDFTPLGAELWQRFCDRRSQGIPRTPFAYTDVVHEKTARYFRTRAAALAEVERAQAENDVVSVTGPCPIGPWRAQWWRRFAAGFRIDIEERRKWQGHASGRGEDCFLRRSPRKADPRRLRDVLDRHNVTFAEWVLLAGMEHGPQRLGHANLPWWLDTTDRKFGAPISPEEYRNGLAVCLRYGWLRVLDRGVIEEVHALLRNDPAVLAVPKIAEIRPDDCCYLLDPFRPDRLVPSPMSAESRWGEIDFSPTGATLYRMISAEWLGPDWEDDLTVWNGYSWEEHHYCEAEEGFERIVPEHVAQDAVIRASRVVPIGPWCVYWWERFPAGYRLELKIGEP